MNTMIRFGVMAVAAAGIAGATSSFAAAECTTLGSVGTSINEGMAKYMAEAGLKNIRENKGLKAEGPLTFKCEPGAVLTDCHARQRACK